MLQPLLLLMLSQAATLPTSETVEPAGRQLKLDVQLDGAFLRSADTNRDGALNLAEFTAEFDRRIDAMIARDPAAQRKLGPNERSKMREGMIAPGFRGLDKNSDNLLTKDEVKSLQK